MLHCNAVRYIQKLTNTWIVRPKKFFLMLLICHPMYVFAVKLQLCKVHFWSTLYGECDSCYFCWWNCKIPVNKLIAM